MKLFNKSAAARIVQRGALSMLLTFLGSVLCMWTQTALPRQQQQQQWRISISVTLASLGSTRNGTPHV
jgi:hypothetical protein